MERVYLDTCVWCRPFDKPTQKIAKEAEALHGILSLADKGKIEITGSSLILFETSMIEASEKREAVLALINRAINGFADITEEIEITAEKVINKCKLDSMDAAHIATAINNNVDTFLTTDEEILEKSNCISKFGINVKNPVDYIKAMKNE